MAIMSTLLCLALLYALLASTQQFQWTKEPPGNNQCPDHSRCDDSGSTCCRLKTGRYNCCPLKNAVCCSSGNYCCPSGTSCNQKEGTCNSILNPIRQKKLPGFYFMNPTDDSESSNQKCPDRKQECTARETCCKTSSGGYGCCPYVGAVCCSDGQHCCPRGSKCDIRHQKCTHPLTRVTTRRLDPEENSVLNTHEKKLNSTMKSVICPEGGVQCPDENTCCKLSDGHEGCCPLPQAVCCPDQVHCCPKGFACLDTGCRKSY